MTARGIRAPLSFGDTSLPRLDVSPSLASIPDTSREWRAQDLLLDSRVTSWTDRRGGSPLTSPGGSARPLVMLESGKKFVRFDGVDDYMLLAGVSLAQPGTRIIRFRFQGTRKPSEGIWQCAGGSLTATISINSAMTGYVAQAGTPLLSSGYAITTNWRTAIAVYNGASSVFSIDGTEFSGAIGANVGDGFQFGRNSGASSTFSTIDIEAIATLPYAADSTKRAAILAQLNA